ncbi:twin-arginine translocase subunit TatC [Candidatus Walczuchella monophlebidarum]|nr:twin-arginine translocase subunit TatC [Candidatus Walczuchella monophlebidarum]
MEYFSSNEKMPFMEHLEELRKHVFRALLSIIVGFALVIINKKIVFDYILFAPARANFISYRLFNKIVRVIHKNNPMILSLNLQIQNTKLLGQFNTYLWVSFIGGIILALPYIFYEIWSFIRPGLSEQERNYSQGIILSALVLFLCGILFGYFILCPLTIQFSHSFRLSYLPENIFDMSNYISIVIDTTFFMGCIFLFPLLVFFLTQIGLITPTFLKTYRKHAFLIMLVIASAITPSDIISMFIATIPLILLYEISIYTSIIFSN